VDIRDAVCEYMGLSSSILGIIMGPFELDDAFLDSVMAGNFLTRLSTISV
jgi:hypothetical protein